MTTPLDKAVSRVSYTVWRDKGKARRLVIKLHPEGLLGIRPQGTRREDFIDFASCLNIAIQRRAVAERARKAKERKERAAGRLPAKRSTGRKS